MAKIHVLLKKEELDDERLEGKIVVVLDILFATSSIVTALAHGCTRVIPTENGEDARAAASGREPGSYVLAGEYQAETLPGFAHPTPLALLKEQVAGRELIYSTTNGTVALAKSRRALQVYAAALLNGAAVVRRIVEDGPGRTVLLVCSGSADNFNLEDFYGAGYLVSLLSASGADFEYSDAALAAELLHAGSEAENCLRQARVGRRTQERGLAAEISYAAQKSVFNIVPQLIGDSLSAN